MKNAIQRFGYTCVAAMIAAGITGSAFGQSLNRIIVNLPEDVKVGANVLPAGSYTIEDLEPASGNHLFLFRSDSKTILVPGSEVAGVQESAKTAVVLTKTAAASQLNKIVIQGSSVGFDFAAPSTAAN